jgi:4-amino-4-deoxy-L-arabinose transferase-like glycosyltransferase
LVAALMMASSILLGVEARLATTDAVLLFTSVAAMGAMARVYLQQRRAPGSEPAWREPAILWTAAAAGVLIKGPLILMFVILTALTVSILDRSTRWIKALRPLVGFAWMIVLVLPWFVAIVAKSGAAFFTDAVGHDMLAKVTSGQEAHGAPPGYYLLLFFITFWPGAVLASLAAPRVWQARREPGAQFLLAWLIPSWLVFEIVMTKLPHYRHSRTWRSRQNTVAGARHARLVCVSEPDCNRRRLRLHLFRPRPWSDCLAVRRRRGGLRPVCLVALRR